MIKNTLVSIDYEVKEGYDKNYGQWDAFTEELKNILDYYKSSIYKAGKVVVNKRIGQKSARDIEFTDIDNKFIAEHDMNKFADKLQQAIINYCDELPKEQLYDQLITIIIGECIVLFKAAQINECKNIKIDKVRLLSDDVYSCSKCKTISKFVYSVKDFDITLIHPYCKLSIIPISTNTTNIKTSIAEFIDVPQILIPNIKNITLKLSIQLKQFITPKKIIFTDCIGIKSKEDVIEISNKLIDKINIEELIVRELLKDKLSLEIATTSWWEDSYTSHKDSRIIGDGCIIYSDPFINNKAQVNYKEYFIQSFIAYILKPTELKIIDEKAYYQLKNIFNKEFIKG